MQNFVIKFSMFNLVICADIIIESWNERGASTILNVIFDRITGSQKDVVCWKALIVIHKLFREGHPQVL
jgi:hypothetical protein